MTEGRNVSLHHLIPSVSLSVIQSFSHSVLPSFRPSALRHAPNNGIFKTLAKISITLNPVNTTKLTQANARSHAVG